MPTTTLLPTGVGFYVGTGFGLTGAATFWQALLSDDGDTSYAARQTGVGGTQKLSVALADLPAGAQGVTLVAIKGKQRDAPAQATTEATLGVRQNATDALGATRDLTNAYVLYADNFLVAPDTTSWNPTKVNSMEPFISNTDPGGGFEFRTSYLYADVTWQGGGAFAFLAGGLVGAALLLQDIPRLVSYLRTRGHVFHPHEYRELYERLSNNPRRVYV